MIACLACASGVTVFVAESAGLKLTGGAPEIELSVRSSGTEVVIEITNQGDPIPADRLESIFEPLVRNGNALPTLSGRLGLGALYRA